MSLAVQRSGMIAKLMARLAMVLVSLCAIGWIAVACSPTPISLPYGNDGGTSADAAWPTADAASQVDSGLGGGDATTTADAAASDAATDAHCGDAEAGCVPSDASCIGEAGGDGCQADDGVTDPDADASDAGLPDALPDVLTDQSSADSTAAD